MFRVGPTQREHTIVAYRIGLGHIVLPYNTRTGVCSTEAALLACFTHVALIEAAGCFYALLVMGLFTSWYNSLTRNLVYLHVISPCWLFLLVLDECR